MKGLALAEEYFKAIGEPLLRERFAAFTGRVAAGLAGPGSECFGFDDELSHDHDWGPAFCLWLADEDFASVGESLRKAYLELPETFMGFGPRIASPGEEWRVGVSTVKAFYQRFTGLDRPPQTPQEWLRVPEASLAACTNGKIFSDPLGRFTAWRNALLAHYPEDVRLKKIASCCITLAQYGQYNYERSMKRGEIFAAAFSEVRFCADAVSLVFLLNRRYAPFYKWMHRAVRELPVLGWEIHSRTAKILLSGDPGTKAEGMEGIAALLIEEIRRQGLSDSPSGFLLDHAPVVHEKIRDPALRARLTVVQ
jgi:hypothetical protein